MGETAAKNRCGRCKRAWYCSRRCQKKHWKEGGHKKVCVEPPCCTICLEGGDEPLPVQCGCACRGPSGLAHVACKAQVAAHNGAGWNLAWEECQTCCQQYTGSMRVGLARSLVRRLERRALADDDRLSARSHLGVALREAGEYAEAEVLLRDVLAVRCRASGLGTHATRLAACDLANLLISFEHYADAAALYLEIVAAVPANEQEDDNTLAHKGNLAGVLSMLGNHAEAEALLHDAKATEERVHGPDDAGTLQTAGILGNALREQGKHAEAEAIYRPTLAAQQRVLGPRHPDTLSVAHNLPCRSSRRAGTPRRSPSSGPCWRGGARAWGRDTLPH